MVTLNLVENNRAAHSELLDHLNSAVHVMRHDNTEHVDKSYALKKIFIRQNKEVQAIEQKQIAKENQLDEVEQKINDLRQKIDDCTN